MFPFLLSYYRLLETYVVTHQTLAPCSRVLKLALVFLEKNLRSDQLCIVS
jgi:hypothetical protein